MNQKPPVIEPVVRVTDLRKSYDDQVVLDGVDLSVPAGSVYALLGSNGAGKTTTIRILATLLRADGGTATIAGHDVAAAPAKVRESISLTGQFAAVDEILTGRENLVLVAKLRHAGRVSPSLAAPSPHSTHAGGVADARRAPSMPARRRLAIARAGRPGHPPRKGRHDLADPGRIADELLAKFSLVDAGGKRVATYSGGMRRRLDIAMSLIGEPPVIFLDEPTTGLDPQARLEVWRTVKDLAHGGTTVLLTTQYLEEAEQLADRIGILHRGRVIVEGTLPELKALMPPAEVQYVEKQPSLEEIFLAITSTDNTESTDSTESTESTEGGLR